jgi:nucleotide-binding universal stress UspA family protein
MAIAPFPFHKILIPFDGSSSAHKALEWAAHLVRVGGGAVARLTLLRVIGGGYLATHLPQADLRLARMDQVASWRRIRQQYLDQEILPLLEEGKRFLQEQGVSAPIEIVVAEGMIGDEIVKLAGEGGYNAIVMGRRGLSAVKELLLGSVTRRVLSLVRGLTVFVVGQEAAFDPACPLSPLLLPVDGSAPSLAAVRQGAALARGLTGCQPQLALLHVIDLFKINAFLDTGTAETASLVKEGEEFLTAGRQILREAGLEGLYTEKLLVGQPSRVIVEEAAAGRHALILMGARGLSSVKQLLLGSVSSEVLHRVTRACVGIVYP